MLYIKKGILKFLLFLALCTITFLAENNEKTEKVNTEELVRYHEIIHHINLLKNNPKKVLMRIILNQKLKVSS